MHTLELIEIGNSLGVVLPEEMLARLRLAKGSRVFVSETPEGVLVTPYDAALAQQVELGREFMRDFRDAFHELAK